MTAADVCFDTQQEVHSHEPLVKDFLDHEPPTIFCEQKNRGEVDRGYVYFELGSWARHNRVECRYPLYRPDDI
jgi:hypothetical protein